MPCVLTDTRQPGLRGHNGSPWRSSSSDHTGTQHAVQASLTRAGYLWSSRVDEDEGDAKSAQSADLARNVMREQSDLTRRGAVSMRRAIEQTHSQNQQVILQVAAR